MKHACKQAALLAGSRTGKHKDRPTTVYARGGQIAACGPNVSRPSVFSGPRKRSQKSSNLKYPPPQHSKH